jgi:hypothetical protein
MVFSFAFEMNAHAQLGLDRCNDQMARGHFLFFNISIRRKNWRVRFSEWQFVLMINFDLPTEIVQEKNMNVLRIFDRKKTMAKTRFLLIASAAFLTFVLPQDIRAQTVPARLVGTGAFDSSDLSFSGEATGNHFGRCSFAGSAVLVPLDDTGLLLGYMAPDVYTAANGDTLELLGIGTVTLTEVDETPSGEPIYTSVWDGTWSVVPTSDGGNNTGRFVNATGAFELTATNFPFAFSDPFWFFIYEKNGELDLGHKKRR